MPKIVGLDGQPFTRAARGEAAPPLSGGAARTGILLYDSTTEVESILASAVTRLSARGVSVGGLLQRFGERLPSGKRAMWVEDIATGQGIRLDRPGRQGARGCVLDPAALAKAAVLFARAVACGPAVILVNRFGEAEAEGAGMRAAITEAVRSGSVVLIPLRFSLLTDLEGFLGGAASLLLPSPLAIADWAEHAARVHAAGV